MLLSCYSGIAVSGAVNGNVHISMGVINFMAMMTAGRDKMNVLNSVRSNALDDARS